MKIHLIGALLCGAACAAMSAMPAYAGEPIPGVDVNLSKDVYNRSYKPTTQGSGAAVRSKRTGVADNNNPLPRDRGTIRFEATGSSLKRN